MQDTVGQQVVDRDGAGEGEGRLVQRGESRGETGALTGGRRRAWTRRRQQSWWGEWSDSECVLKEEMKEFVMSGVGQKEREKSKITASLRAEPE